MTKTLRDLIEARLAQLIEQERAGPGHFWATGGIEDDGLSREDAHVFGIRYEDYPRMLAAWYVWFDFIELTRPEPEDEIVLQRERKRYPGLLKAGNEPEPFKELDMWLAQFRRFWSGHVDALERHLDEMDEVATDAKAKKKTSRRPRAGRNKGESK